MNIRLFVATIGFFWGTTVFAMGCSPDTHLQIRQTFHEITTIITDSEQRFSELNELSDYEKLMILQQVTNFIIQRSPECTCFSIIRAELEREIPDSDMPLPTATLLEIQKSFHRKLQDHLN